MCVCVQNKLAQMKCWEIGDVSDEEAYDYVHRGSLSATKDAISSCMATAYDSAARELCVSVTAREAMVAIWSFQIGVIHSDV